MADVRASLHFLLLLFLSSEAVKLVSGVNVSCTETERKALLDFKEGLTDPSGILSSWVGQDCCRWRGVVCRQQLSRSVPPRVVKLKLRSPDEADAGGGYSLGGEIRDSLLDLRELRYLDLSMNYFGGLEIPEFIGSFRKLRYLNLSTASFGGAIPPHLGNLSGLLTVLDLSNNGFNSSVPDWLSNFTSLSYLDLNSNSLQGSLPEGLGDLISLQHVDLSSNLFIGGRLPRNLGKLCNLRVLKLSFNSMSGGITEFVDGLSGCVNGSRLESLDLGYNYKLDGFLPDSLGQLRSLRSLQLWSNSFVGSIPSSIGNLTSLQELYLAGNEMNGMIPETVGRLSAMVAMDLSENPWVGVVTESHFSNLTSLTQLVIKKTYANVSLVFDVSPEWVPPFKLSYLELQSCQVGPKFPAWLRNQTQLKTIVLHNTRISDSIPDWFWELDLQLNQLDLASNQISGSIPSSLRFSENAEMDLSSNRFQGPLPHFSSNLYTLYLSDNLFSGPIPHDFGKTMTSLSNFDVSWNSLNGTIPLSLGEAKVLTSLVLSNNHLSGEIPLIWDEKPDLYIVDLANNNFSGGIPSSMGTLSSLKFLSLSGNKLSGKIPSSLRNCTQMYSFDLGGNRFSGDFPSWIGEMPSLLILRLRSNVLRGNIPSQLCTLSHLHILDVAHNCLSGSIPSCLGNLTGMATELSEERYEGQLTVVVKGRELQYQSTLYLVNSIDLSDNHLSGNLPKLRNLSRLGTLNLSMNHLTGSIPDDIGSLSQLETLDLSRNQLSGSIPQTMVALTSLTHLNLSNNMLSGRIPSTNQFGTLNDPSIYSDNLALCGRPLVNKCQGDEDEDAARDEDHDGDDDEFEMKWFLVSMGLGFVVGLWGVFGSLILNRSWRGAYFRFLDEVKDRMMMAIHVNVARLQRRT